ncbi:MAG: TonB C-terminal domain-containing protein [Betaproteobacteria bacterium]|nr:TonB C-terminal domain-containing protein [Betaproteobacteria bacterium]
MRVGRLQNSLPTPEAVIAQRPKHQPVVGLEAIRANTVFGQSFTGNPRAEFTVSLSAACEVLQVRLKSSSGNKSWDEAAERAINRTTPFPKPPSGSCPGSMLISHQPRDGSKEGMM